MTTTAIYPFFLECGKYTYDEYWLGVFRDCSNNRFPKHMLYNSKERLIRVRVTSGVSKTKNEVFHLPEEVPEAFKMMMFIFRKKLGLLSSRDLQDQTEEMERQKKKNLVDMDCPWSKLKPRVVKDELIMVYVEDLTNKYRLRDRESKSLLSTIQLGFQNKQIASDHVDYRNRRIQNINGLEFNEETREFVITNPPASTSKTDKTVVNRQIYRSCDEFIRRYSQQLKRLEG